MTSILITGGSGSFGRAFVKRLLLDSKYTRIAVYSRGEHAQEDMERQLRDERLRFFIGDVRDRDRLELAMRGVEVVVHAAALKVVPIAEYNPTECVATNVGGAENVVKAALRSEVRTVVALSTDKAVNPINLYGTSKLAAEKIFVAANALSAGTTSFSVVRYGNVWGSQGSVVPLFKKLKAEGKPLTITDPGMTRFHITMDQAIELVERAIEMREYRSIHVPKIPSLKVMAIAEAIDPGGHRHMVGIRPGEKLHECLLTEHEARTTSDRVLFYTIHQDQPDLFGVQSGFRYTSDTNPEWMSVEEIRALL